MIKGCVDDFIVDDYVMFLLLRARLHRPAAAH